MKWITRDRPKIDRIACPWLIRRFVDDKAEFIYVPAEEVKSRAVKFDAIPFDVPEVEYTHYGDECTFDFILKKHGIDDPALFVIAKIVRGADTDRHDLAPQASGLWSISAGLSHNFKDDYAQLEQGMILYDALYSWAKYLRNETHTQSGSEKLLLEIYEKFIRKQKNKRIPKWVNELRELIQDQIDTNISLKQISKELDINPSYVSREFSKHFDQQTFGEYVRTMRIDRAKRLLLDTKYTLTQVAYLTGFSDQSHFTRIFKKHTGENPSEYRKNLPKR
jgi:AraC-like DNA-binding protein